MATSYAIKWLKDKLGVKFFPVTHLKAVRDDNNIDLDVLLGRKQDTLVSGTNIKTINDLSILGSGNITISGDSSGEENTIEVIKVNGSALTPDANKAVDITVPTNMSDLNNDAGFITTSDIPEGAAASTTSPKMDGTASVGTEMAFARGDHRHPSDTSKLDVISDLATIRSGAEAGATAYLKPSTGIPKTDLASAVLTSLGKADTALQSESDPVFGASAASGITSSDISNWNSKTSNVGTITGITMNGTSKGTSGVVDLGTVITSHLDISGKADKSSTVSTITYDTTNKKITKTINGTTSDVVTAAKIVTDGGGITTETDPVYSASAASGITSTDISNWNNKVEQMTWYGTSDTSASTAAKVVTCSGFKLEAGAIVGILFTTANTAATPTLNINSTGAKSIHVGSATPSATANVLKWSANTMLYFMYDGTLYKFLTAVAAGSVKSPLGAGTWYGISSTGATTAAKVSTIDNYILTQGSLVTITFTAANTYTGGAVTLNINSTGAKNIYYNNAVTSTTNTLLWNANDVLTFMYSGSYYYFIGKAVTKTSLLLNDSGFITTSDIPEGAAASTTSPKMNGTAAVGTELAFARGDHVHPSDTSKADKATTLSGYGITDAKIANGVITLGSNTITPLTSFTETDPIFSASAAAGIQASDITNWNSKTSNTGNVTGSNLTANLIILGNGSSAIKASGKTIETSLTSDSDAKIPTSKAVASYVTSAVNALPEPMIFKGSLGTSGTITSLPAAAADNTGFTYKVITAGTYASLAAKVGDTFISDGTTWNLIPSGDEPSGTVTSITLKATSPIAIDSTSAITTSGTRTLSHVNSGVTAGTYRSVTVNATGHVTAGTNPTTLGGYGITDAKIASGTITLGSNTITPLTASSTLDATKLSGTIPTDCYSNTDTKVTLTATTTNSAYEILFSGTADNTNRTEGVRKTSTLTYNPSTKALVTGGTVNGYTLAAASAKSVDTSIAASSSSANLPTSAAVASFVEGKGYLPTTGGYLTGSMFLRYNNVDATLADNGYSQYSWSSEVLYPTTFSIHDKNLRILARLEGNIDKNGRIGTYLYVRNYDTAGNQTSQRGLSLFVDKSSTYTTAYFSPSVRVGIGISTPQHALDVDGIGQFSNNVRTAGHVVLSTNNRAIYFTDSDGNTNQQIIYNASNSFVLGALQNTEGRNTYLRGYTLSLQTGTSNTLALFIDSDQKVGVGTSSPSYKLHVNGTIGCNNQLISTVGTGTSPFSITSTTVNDNLNADLWDGFHHTYYQGSASTSQGIKLLTLVTNSTYRNEPFTFDIKGRSSVYLCHVSIRFNNSSTTNHSLSSFTYTGDSTYGSVLLIFKINDTTWEVWCEKTLSYDRYYITNISEITGVEATFNMEYADALPTGTGTTCTKLYDSDYVTLNTSQTISATKTFTGDIIMGSDHYIYGVNETNGSMLHHDGNRTVIGSVGATSTLATHLRSKTGHLTVGTANTASYNVVDSGNIKDELVGACGNGTSNLTDDTEIITSYAAAGGFDASGHVNSLYRRSGLKVWGYIKDKANSYYPSIYVSNGNTIEANTDLNTILSAGTYVCYSGDVTATLTNAPLSSGNFRLWHISNTGTNGDAKQWFAHLVLAPNSPRLWLRGHTSGGFTTWKTIAFTTDNVSSATKLYTARSLWGNSFDGSADIDGQIKSSYGGNGTFIGGVSNAALTCNYTGNYCAILNAPTKNGRISLSTYKNNDDYVYLGYASQTKITNGTNSFDHQLRWNGENGQLLSDAATGTAPFSIASTTVNTNLNADLLDGIHANGLFTSLTTDSTVSTKLSITIGGTTKTINYYAPSVYRYIHTRIASTTGGWYKIFTMTIGARYSYGSANFMFTDLGKPTSGTCTASHIIFHAQLQNAFGSAPYVKLYIVDGNMDVSNLKAVYTLNSDSTTIDVYACANDAYMRPMISNIGTYVSNGTWDYPVGDVVDAPTFNVNSEYANSLMNENFNKVTYNKYQCFRNNANNANAGYVGVGSTGNNNIALTAYSGNSLLLGANGTTVLTLNGTTVASTQNIELTNSDPHFRAYNTNGSIELLASTNRGVYDRTNSRWLITTDGTNTWLACGNVGIGTASPSQKLHVRGNILASGEITAYSDIRLKKNIKPLQVRGELKPMTYEKDGKQSIGFIAQDVLEIYPELVTELGEDKMLSLNYAQLTAVLQAEILELKEEIKKLKNNK